MLAFNRYVNDLVIYILIKESFYKKYHVIFDSFLRTYTLYDKKLDSCYNENNYFCYICENMNEYEFVNKSENNYCTICDTHNENWIFTLLNYMESFYADILKCTVIHGSCISINGKNILFTGERKTGKTTITYFLANNMNGVYLDDDCIYIIKNGYIGFGMPMPIRHDTGLHNNNSNKKIFIAQTTDDEGVKRLLYLPKEIIDCCEKIDVVVFPKFDKNSTNSIKKMQQTEAFQALLKNVRNYSDMKAIISDIKKLISIADCIKITYSSSESAYNLLCE